MAKVKIYGEITSVGEPDLDKKLVSFEIQEEGNEKSGLFGMTCFEKAMTDRETMANLVVGQKVTATAWINSKEKVSQMGNRFFNISLACDKIEAGNTTGIEKKEKAAPDSIFVPGGEQIGLGNNESSGDIF